MPNLSCRDRLNLVIVILFIRSIHKGLPHFKEKNPSRNDLEICSKYRLLVRKDDVKEFNKGKDPVISILKGETKADPILKTGERFLIL